MTYIVDIVDILPYFVDVDNYSSLIIGAQKKIFMESNIPVTIVNMVEYFIQHINDVHHCPYARKRAILYHGPFID